MLSALLAAVLVSSCAPYRVVESDSTNQSSRIQYLVIHFTSQDYAESLRLLTQPSDNPVSSHYLIPETDDSSYSRSRLRIFRLVPEHRRAWHAGPSAWGDEVALNNRSIGIELVNVSHCTRDDPEAVALEPIETACEFHSFAEEQIDLLIVLARDILARFPEIDPVDIVGHADIAPDRKVDPGPTFPWKRLHDEGIGAWYDDETVERYRQQFSSDPPDVETIRKALKLYGYPVDTCGDVNVELQQVLRAFQMHFLPDAVSLEPDLETAARLFALVEKYREEEMPGLTSEPGCGDPTA